METTNSQAAQQTTALWITSLAVSVTCCAVLFVIFAGYLTDIKKNLAEENAQLEQMSIHQEQLLLEIQSLHRTLSNGNPVQAPGPAASVPASSTAPAPAATSAAPAPSAAPAAAAPVTPPTATPTAIPEVPAKP